MNASHFPSFLQWQTFRFILEATGPIALPEYKGSTFRGALLTNFRKIVCAVPGRQCADCMLHTRCTYARLFEANLPEDHPDSRKYRKPPQPYILNPPFTRARHFDAGDILEFELVLLGPAIEALPYFIYTTTAMGQNGLGSRQGNFRLARVDRITGGAEHPDVGAAPRGRPGCRADRITCGSAYLVYDGATEKLLSPPEIADFIPASAPDGLNAVELEFFSPLRLFVQSRLVTRLTFPVLFESLARRLQLLAGFYGKPDQLSDVTPLVEKAAAIRTAGHHLQWHDWERYSGRQKTRMRFGGLTGRICFEGDLAPFLPWLAVGEQLNVGQLTTFGLGKYRILNRTNNRGQNT